MARLELDGVGKAYAGQWAVRDLSLCVEDGEFLTLLGPSGCGKTTTLRMIAGFVAPTAGRILLDGRPLSAASPAVMVPPERRGMGMVFQNYAVWPHMTAAGNVAYPLRRARLPRAEVESRTHRVLTLVHMDAFSGRYPQQLSGGQQQRIALARALVVEPSVLLLDEPLSNLDAPLREEMRAEIKDLQARLGITVVYVTHDQAEAMALSGRIAVLRAGRVVQLGTPTEVYEQPADPFVAASLGVANLLPAAVVKADGGETRVRLVDGSGAEIAASGRIAESQALVCIRPEDLEFDARGPLRGTVQSCTYLGSHVDYLVRVGELTLRVQTRGRVSVRPGVAVGLRVRRAIAYPHSTWAVTSFGNPDT